MKRQTLWPLATLALLPGLAQAATATTTFPVSTTVLTACTVTAQPLVFSSYNPTSASNTDGTTTVAVLCTSGTPYSVALDKGTSGSSVTARRMVLTAGSDLLPYQLFSDSGRSSNWGSTVGTDAVAGSATGVAQTLTIYGRIPAGASVAAGVYTDTVTVSVNY